MHSIKKHINITLSFNFTEYFPLENSVVNMDWSDKGSQYLAGFRVFTILDL